MAMKFTFAFLNLAKIHIFIPKCSERGGVPQLRKYSKKDASLIYPNHNNKNSRKIKEIIFNKNPNNLIFAYFSPPIQNNQIEKSKYKQGEEEKIFFFTIVVNNQMQKSNNQEIEEEKIFFTMVVTIIRGESRVCGMHCYETWKCRY